MLKTTSSNLNIALNYDEHKRQLNKYNELLNGTPIDSRALSVEGFSPFSVLKQGDNLNTAFFVHSSPIEGSGVTLEANNGSLSTISMTYKEPTFLGISAGKFSTTLDFECVPSSHDTAWSVRMIVDVPSVV